MENDEKVLKYIAKNENVSQRQLANYAGLSLGNLNLVLHKLVGKGFIKIEKINPRSLRYILTPNGIARNTKRTYNYIQNAFKLVLTIDQEVLLTYNKCVSEGCTVFVDGSNDEIKSILKQVAKERKLDGIIWVESFEEIQEICLSKKLKPMVILWQSEKEDKYKKQKMEYINILERIDD